MTPFFRILPLFAALCLIAVLFPAFSANAETRVLDEIRVDRGSAGSEIAVTFHVPLRHVTHVPAVSGDVLQIQMRPVGAAQAGATSGLSDDREVLHWKPSVAVPLREVSFEADAPGGPLLILRFTRRVAFKVKGARDLRGIVVTLPVAGKPAAKNTPASPAAAPKAKTTPKGTAPKGTTKVTMALPPVPEERLTALMTEAETSMTEGDYRRAIQLYTKLVQYPDHKHTEKAQEHLGLARERKGQLAHAKAEYESYLRRYPKGEGTERVRQRLAGLLTAAAKPKDKLRRGKREQIAADDVRWDVYGSLSEFYRRDESFTELDGKITNQSALTSDLDVTARGRSDAYDAHARLSAGHTANFLSGSDSDTRVSTLYLDVLDKRREVSGRLGRQSRNTGGVLGRFDGGLVSYQVNPEIKLNAVGGFPVQSSSDDGINSDRHFYGLSADLGPFAEFWEFNVFAINQVADGFADRRAVGGEARYSHPDMSVFSLIDYDILFMELNNLLMVGTYTFPDKATLNMSLTHQKSPVLTTSNALQGQTVGSLAALENLFSEDAIRDMAVDRTATNTSLTLGASHPLNTKFQISGDFTVSHLSDTETSGGVAGTPDTGAEYFYSTQLLGTNLIKEGDIAILGLRFSDTSTSDTVSFTVNTRYPGTENLRINPRLRVDYQKRSEGGGRRITLRPSLRLNYRWERTLNFELESGGEWSSDKASGTDERTLGYFVNAGVRFDF